MNDIALPADAARKPRPAGPTRGLRKPTGKPSWPILLLAGREKAGKSYQAALASSSELIDRTFWVGFGEKDPDEYGAIPGSRFEIAEHNGTLADLKDTIRYLLTIERQDKPHMLVLDSGTRIWTTLRDKATYIAQQRGKKDREGEFIVTMDIWNKVNTEWVEILNLVRRWNGPVIITARLDTVAVIENGKPTNQKSEKVQGQKSLAYDVDAIVEMPERGKAELVGARSVIYQIPSRVALPDFTVDGLWRKLGLATVETEQATYAEPPTGEAQTDGPVTE
ncbi:AAA family ATPase [Plantibacter sp. YIM 135249]|uniref:AAA family ATPase n=1 Tax=Plantibacter sp. YIM 135249 TaxID=3423918 RepID=UPI003D354959